MIFSGITPNELFRIRKADGKFHSITKDNVSPASTTADLIESDLRTAANISFPESAKGWHFYIHVPADQVSTLQRVWIWGGPKDMEPRENWWER